jgi:hypothetical protein
MISFFLKYQILNVQIAYLIQTICKRLGVPSADEKTECPVTSLEYFGLIIDTISNLIPILRTISENQHIKLAYPHH